MTSLDAAVYRLAIRLYPHPFWRAFHDELEADFDCAIAEARAAGAASVVACWARATADLIVSLVREWLRTPWIPVLAAAALLSVSLFGFTAFKVQQWPRQLHWPARQAITEEADSLSLLVLMIVGALIPIVGTILGSLWMLLLQRSVANRKRRRV